jgi:hypothetical protein
VAVKTYTNPAAFQAALESRVRDLAKEQGRPVNRVRTLLVMERFLARIVAVFPASAILKGGLALELRLHKARTTRDIDLRLLGAPGEAAVLMARAAALVPEPDDFLRFVVTPNAEHPTMEGEGVVYEGFRFDVNATLAARRYADPFGVDVAYADVVHGPPDELVGSDLFSFIGSEPVRVRAYPAASHLAEKLHAYTLPRKHPNSRVKDLADIALIATMDGHDAEDLAAAIGETFAFRATHPVPAALPDPPPDWVERYRRMARDEDLPWRELDELLLAARAFLDPVLAAASGRWDPERWTWTGTGSE